MVSEGNSAVNEVQDETSSSVLLNNIGGLSSLLNVISTHGNLKPNYYDVILGKFVTSSTITMSVLQIEIL